MFYLGAGAALGPWGAGLLQMDAVEDASPSVVEISRGLGWFSLFVAITAVPVAIDTLRAASSTWEWWLGLSWAAWSVLWLMFFMLLALQRPIARLTATLAIGQGVLTGWLPGYLLLTGVLR